MSEVLTPCGVNEVRTMTEIIAYGVNEGPLQVQDFALIAVGTLAVFVCVAACVFVWRFVTGWLERTLRREVFANLDDARSNGHFEPGEYLDRASAEEIAEDMALHAEWSGNAVTAEVLTPYVRKWLRMRGLV
jgi:hypothetical protein